MFIYMLNSIVYISALAISFRKNCLYYFVSCTCLVHLIFYFFKYSFSFFLFVSSLFLFSFILILALAQIQYRQNISPRNAYYTFFYVYMHNSALLGEKEKLIVYYVCAQILCTTFQRKHTKFIQFFFAVYSNYIIISPEKYEKN